MPRLLSELAAHTGSRLIGQDETVSSIASVESAKAGDLVFVEHNQRLDDALRSPAAAIIAGEFAAGTSSGKPLLISPQPRLAFAKAAALILPANAVATGVHPTAAVDKSSNIAQNVSIGELTVVGKDVVIGDNSSIGAGCVLSAGVQIGSNCNIYPNVTIYSGTTLGNRVIVHAGAVLGSDGFGYVRDEKSGRYFPFPQIGRLEIEDDVEAGARAVAH